MMSGIQRITLLLGSAAPGAGYLCPTVEVVSKDSTTQITIAADDAQWLRDGDVVLIYNRGEEQKGTPESATYTINAVGATTVTFTGALASWVAAGSIVTYPAHSSCTTRQQAYTHQIETDKWS